MAITYIAQLPWSLLVPSVYLSVGQVSVGLNASLQGNLAINASLRASPPTLATTLQASAEFSAQCQTCLSPEWLVPPLTPPLSVSFTVSDVVSLQASLNASLNIHLPSLLSLLAFQAGIYSFTYGGIGSGLGAAVTSELSSSWPDGAPVSGNCTALIFGAVSALAKTNIAAFLTGLTFGSGLVYTGKIGVSSICPLVPPAAAQGSASIGAAITASASLKPSVQTFLDMLSAQAKFYANLQLVGQVAPPSFAISATASAAASLQVHFGASCGLGAALSQVGAAFFVYEYTGPANAMGAALTTALASTWGDTVTPSSTACVATVLAATDALSIANMLGFFGGA